MSVFTPEYKLSINGVEYTDVAISDIAHQAGREDIYAQPTPSYIQIALVALNNENYSFQVNDGIALQVKDSTNVFRTLFGGNITDITTEVASASSVAETFTYTIIALGSLAKLPKVIYDGTLARDDDGDQIHELLADLFLNSWNEVPAAETWSGYDPTITWANAENAGLGEIDRPGVYEITARGSNPDTVYNIASLIADSAFGVLYEDNEGRIGYADAVHRQNYLANNGYTEISANAAFGAGLKILTRGADVRNEVFINYGNNFGSQVSAIDLDSIAIFGYRGETINTVLHDATDAQNVADRYIDLRSYPRALFDSITFPLTNSAIDDVDRDALLQIFIGQPMRITDLPVQIAPTGQFEGYVEGWRWSTRFNELFLTINLSPIEFSQIALQWEQVSASEAWNTLSGTLTWENAIGAVA
ncbi:hypothetical protein UFOVP444_10 [uncultured Caudovirales phage]|uniref:Uncharacterized protein n=1 Tax=uncultured Caudovirales phage TaxID=2100421 RepID=A0A6J5M6E4_9CAUD|nr:hypothetical protein UFOVP444_10 [uncultured Caudovirales phage]